MNKAFTIILFIISFFCLSSNYLIKKSLQGEFALNNSFPGDEISFQILQDSNVQKLTVMTEGFPFNQE